MKNKIEELRKFIIKNPRKSLALAIVIVLIITLILNFRIILGTKIDIYSPSFSAEPGKSDYVSYKNGAVCAVNDGIYMVDTKGNKKWNVKTGLLSPFVNVCGDYIIAADTEGTSAAVIKNGSLVYNIKLSAPAYYSDVNKNGYSIIVTGEAGYKSLVNVYNKKGENIYQWYSGEWNITDAVISDDNKHIAVSGIDISGNAVKTVVQIFDIRKEEPMGTFTADGTLCYKLCYTDSGILMLTGDKAYCLDKKGKIKREYSFSGKKITAYDFDDKDKMAVAYTKADVKENANFVVVFSSGLRRKTERRTDFAVKSVDCTKSRILCSGSGRIKIIENIGIPSLDVKTDKDLSYTRLVGNGKAILSFSDRYANIYKIKNGRW